VNRLRFGAAIMTKPFHLLILIIVAVTAWRIANLVFGHMPLIADEAQYWTWAKALDWGYFTKPPLIGWSIAATTALCGDGEACARLSSPLYHAGTALLVGAFASRLVSDRAGFWSGLLYLTLPGVSFAAVQISTDTPLLFCAALATYGLVRLRESPAFKWALLIGLGVGFGLLAKYAMSYWLIGLLLVLVLDKQTRASFSPKLAAVTALTGFVILLPNLLWNMDHGFVTVTHVGDNANLSTDKFGDFSNLAEFFGSQFGVFSPILMLALLIGTVLPSQWRDPVSRFLLCFALPALVVVTVQSFLNRANANWAAMAYVAATPFAVKLILEKSKSLYLSLSAGLGLTAVALIGMMWMAPHLFMRIGAFDGLYHRYARGQAVLGEIRPELDLGLYAGVIADDRKMVANLLYHGRGRDLQAWRLPRTDGVPVDHYTLKQPLPDRLDEPVLLLFRDETNVSHPRLADFVLLKRFETPKRRWALYAARLAPQSGSAPD